MESSELLKKEVSLFLVLMFSLVILSLVVVYGLQGDPSEKNTKNGAYLNGGNVRQCPHSYDTAAACIAPALSTHSTPLFPALHHSPSTIRQGPTLGEELVNGEKVRLPSHPALV